MKTCGCLLVLLLWASPASAQTWTVNSTRDVVDASVGNGICDTGGPAAPDGSPECTLRAAVQEANANRRFYHHIRVPAGVYVLTLRHLPSSLEEDIGQGTGAWPISRSVAVGDLDIDVDTSITGDGQGVTVIDGGDVDRVFAIWPNATEAGFQDLTIRNGTSQRQGGCLWNQSRTILGMRNVTVEDCVADLQVGGGIYNGGHALFERVTIRNNVAVRGGGMESSEFARINESTFSGNTASPSFGREGGGGGLSNFDVYPSRPSVTLTNSVVWGNQAEYGGGILNHGSMGITNSTLSGNRSVSGGSAISFRPPLNTSAGSESLGIGFSTIANNMGTALELSSVHSTVSATILAGNVGRFDVAGDNCTRMIGVSDHTFEDGRACLLIGPGDRFDVDPLLGPLADHGGPTLTHALLDGSPAIDVLTRSQPRDQRGVPRPVGAMSDIGAYEFGMDPFELTLLIPIDWTFIFGTAMTEHAVGYSLHLNLKTLGKPAAPPRIVGIKPADGQSQIKFQLDSNGEAVTVSGVAVPPKQGSAEVNPLFYVLVQQGIGTPGQLRATSAACDCDAKPRKSQSPIVIPPYQAKKGQ